MLESSNKPSRPPGVAAVGAGTHAAGESPVRPSAQAQWRPRRPFPRLRPPERIILHALSCQDGQGIRLSGRRRPASVWAGDHGLQWCGGNKRTPAADRRDGAQSATRRCAHRALPQLDRADGRKQAFSRNRRAVGRASGSVWIGALASVSQGGRRAAPPS